MTVAVAPRLIVQVIQSGGVREQLTGRAAAIALWISVYGEQINEMDRGTIQIDWKGAALQPTLHRKFDSFNIDTLLPLSDQSCT